jgi:hypothetical protein
MLEVDQEIKAGDQRVDAKDQGRGRRNWKEKKNICQQRAVLAVVERQRLNDRWVVGHTDST